MPTASQGWTGGQYSIYRFALGAALALRLVQALPVPDPLPDAGAIPFWPNALTLGTGAAGSAVLAAAALGALLLAVGAFDRVAASMVAYVWFCAVDVGLWPASPAVLLLGLLPLLHLLVPAAPYGSLAARGRPDPGGGWRMPRAIHAAAWLLLAAAFFHGGVTKLLDPTWTGGAALAERIDQAWAPVRALGSMLLALPHGSQAIAWIVAVVELLAAPLAAFRRLRPRLWNALAALQLLALLLDGYLGMRLGGLLLLALAWDPGWFAARGGALRELLFYDGDCGLCHRWVRFVLAEDPGGHAFHFAPLQGDTFRRRVPEAQRERLPDSIVVLRRDGVPLVRSAAVRHVLKRLGGVWGMTGVLSGLCPAFLLDAGYDFIAAARHRLFRRPGRLCPVVPRELADRFE